MSFFRALLVSLSAFLIAAQPADAGRLKIKGGYLQQNLGSLALSTPNGTAGTSGSSAITGATPGSTLTMQNTVGGLYSVDSGARSLIWTSGVVAGTDNPVVRETLAGFANSPHDNTLPVTIAASGYTTGQSIAKAGPVQYPHLLDANAGTNTNGVSIPYRPSWAVVGVDYRAGPDSSQSYAGKTLPGDAANLPACASYSSGSHQVNINSTPCTLDGWDFADSTIYLQVDHATVTIQNCKYLATTANTNPFFYANYYDTDSNLTIQFCEVDGAYLTGAQPGIIMPPAGTTLVQMNVFKRISEDINHIRTTAGTVAVTTRWNLVVDQGSAWDIHGDVIQVNGSLGGGHAFNNVHSTGNTIYQEFGDGSNRPAALNTVFRMGDNPAGTDYVNPEWDHDTVVSIGTNHVGNNAGTPYYAYPGNINLEQVGDSTAGHGNTTNWLVHDNYFFSDSTTYASTQRTIFGIYAQAHVVNVTYTISPNNYFMWDGTTWPTTLP